MTRTLGDVEVLHFFNINSDDCKQKWCCLVDDVAWMMCGGGGGVGEANHVRCCLLTKDDVVLWMMLHG